MIELEKNKKEYIFKPETLDYIKSPRKSISKIKGVESKLKQMKDGQKQ